MASTHQAYAIVIDDYLTDYRNELRDFLRELSNYCPGITVTWLITCATDSLREYVIHGHNSDVVEVLLHAITAVTKYILLYEDYQVIHDFILQLAPMSVVNAREICRLAVVVYGELLSLMSVNSNRQQVLLNLLFSVKHSEQALGNVPFRVKQDHIGIVTVTKAATAGYYTAVTPIDITNIRTLYRDIMTPLPIEPLYHTILSSDQTLSLMDVLYAATVYSCSKTSQITWKSCQIMITGLVAALGTNYRHEFSRLTEYYLCLLPFFIASAYWYGVETSQIHAYVASRSATASLTPGMIAIMLEIGELISQDGMDDVLTALAMYTSSNGVLLATIASDLLVPWLDMTVTAAGRSHDRVEKLIELGRIISVSTMLISCTNQSNILDARYCTHSLTD